MNCDNQEQTVVVTGMGIISAVGIGVSAFLDALYQGKSNFIRSSDYPMLSFPVIGAFLPNFIFSQDLKKFPFFSQQLEKIGRHAPRSIQMAIIAMLEAWQQAKLNQIAIADSEKIGLIVAGENTTGHYQYHSYATFRKDPNQLSPYYALHFMDTDHVGVLSEIFGILGEGFTVGGASATGNVALVRAYQMLRNNWQNVCVVLGALADLSPMELQAFHNLGALGGAGFEEEPNKACRPFDKGHEGFIYGQAIGCLILETEFFAKKRNAAILGYLLGGSSSLDGNRLTQPNLNGEIRSMNHAMHVSGVTEGDIDYINAHGSSTPQGDQIEIKAIESIFGQGQKLKINSTKSIIGHCLWSAGIVEAIATLVQMQEGFVHPNLNLDNPITFKNQLVGKERLSFQINTALSNSFGFGGINSTIILSRNPKMKR